MSSVAEPVEAEVFLAGAGANLKLELEPEPRKNGSATLILSHNNLVKRMIFFLSFSVDPSPAERKAASLLLEALEEASIVNSVHSNLA